MLNRFTELLDSANDIIWASPLIALVAGIGVLFTLRLGALQFRYFGRAIYYVLVGEKSGSGEVSGFGALCTAVSATVGTGNIILVAAAVSIGGPGAIFWMVAVACFGMATKYAEGFLAVKYRSVEIDGHTIGGPFYYIENGMGKGFKWLAKLFAFFGAFAALFGVGTMLQSRGIVHAVNGLLDDRVSALITTAVIALIAAAVIIGGVRRIASFSVVATPLAATLYTASCLLILIYNFKEIPYAFTEIFVGAFGLRAAASGVLGAVLASMKGGAAIGVSSNEAGFGSAPIAAAAAISREPARQGLISMMGTFIDTIVICNLTGLVILVTHSWDKGLHWTEVVFDAFSNGFIWPQAAGAWILSICIILFAFGAIIGWNYYGERCIEYLAGGRGGIIAIYRLLYIAAIIAGPFFALNAVWALAHILNGLMALPNLIALFLLSGVVVAETRSYAYRTRSRL